MSEGVEHLGRGDLSSPDIGMSGETGGPLGGSPTPGPRAC